VKKIKILLKTILLCLICVHATPVKAGDDDVSWNTEKVICRKFKGNKNHTEKCIISLRVIKKSETNWSGGYVW
jgi:hypothetical protein